MIKWIIIIAAALFVVYVLWPALRGNSTRFGWKAEGGGNGTGAQHQLLV